MTRYIFITICLLLSAASTGAAAQEEEHDELKAQVLGTSLGTSLMTRKDWAFHGGLYVQWAQVTHQQIEHRITTFQAEKKPTRYIAFFGTAGVRYKEHHFELDGLFSWPMKIDFLDEDHFMEMWDFQLVLWYRPAHSFTISDAYFSVLPGLGVGYAWSSLDVGIYDEEVEYDVGTSVISGSGPVYYIGIRFDLFGLEGSPYGEQMISYIAIDYRYRFTRKIKADPVNDGYIFFPDGAEFDFEGHYFAVGVSFDI